MYKIQCSSKTNEPCNCALRWHLCCHNGNPLNSKEKENRTLQLSTPTALPRPTAAQDLTLSHSTAGSKGPNIAFLQEAPPCTAGRGAVPLPSPQELQIARATPAAPGFDNSKLLQTLLNVLRETKVLQVRTTEMIPSNILQFGP